MRVSRHLAPVEGAGPPLPRHIPGEGVAMEATGYPLSWALANNRGRRGSTGHQFMKKVRMCGKHLVWEQMNFTDS